MEAKMCTFYQPGWGDNPARGLGVAPGVSLALTVPGQQVQGCGGGRHSGRSLLSHQNVPGTQALG